MTVFELKNPLSGRIRTDALPLGQAETFNVKRLKCEIFQLSYEMDRIVLLIIILEESKYILVKFYQFSFNQEILLNEWYSKRRINHL